MFKKSPPAQIITAGFILEIRILTDSQYSYENLVRKNKMNQNKLIIL
jgi:hypothetical protein